MHSMLFHLNDRALTPDGKLVVAPDKVEELLIRGIPLSQIRVTAINNEIKKFNAMTDEQLQLLSDENIELNLDWLLPQEFKSLDLDKYIASMITTEHNELAEIRLENEYQEFKRRNMEMFLRTVIFIVSEFKKKNIVWGVGRGSSCASYLLYRIGLHSVNPLKYKIPYSEFFHD